MTSVHASKPPVVAILGPTAIGKTAASLALGSVFPIEIVNADSRSFYRRMDIGTAKPDAIERATVPHHLIDILEPDESMSLAIFQDLAYATFREIHERGNVPFLVGGTPQYVNAVVEGWSIPRVPPDEAFRRELEREAELDGVTVLQERLRAVDPEAAERNGANLRRIVRALEVYAATGQSITSLQTKQPVPFMTREYELYASREFIHARIDRRIDHQVANGLIEEVRALLAEGISPAVPAFSSIGYRQVIPYLEGEATLAEITDRLKIDTHRLVRHQQTWFRKNPRLVQIDVTTPGWLEELQAQIAGFLTPWIEEHPTSSSRSS